MNLRGLGVISKQMDGWDCYLGMCNRNLDISCILQEHMRVWQVAPCLTVLPVQYAGLSLDPQSHVKWKLACVLL